MPLPRQSLVLGTDLTRRIENEPLRFRLDLPFLVNRMEPEPLRFRLDLRHAPPFAENRLSSE